MTMMKPRSLIVWFLLCWLAGAPLAAQDRVVSGSTPTDQLPLGGEGESIEDPAEQARQEAEWAERNAVLTLRLSDRLEPEASEAARAVIDTLPGVVVGRLATHEIGPRPSIEEIIALYEIPGAIPHAAFSTTRATLGITRSEDLFQFYSNTYESENDWAWSIARPVELGLATSDGFAERLRATLLRLARRAALVEFAIYNSDGRISMCLSNEPSRPGHCPLPTSGRSWNEVIDLEPIHLTLEAPAGEARHFTLVAVGRDGQIIPLETGDSVQYISDPGTGPDGEASRAIPQVRLVFRVRSTLNDKLAPGHYDLIAILSEEPVPDEFWERANNLPYDVPDAGCEPTRWQGLCRALQGGRGMLPFDIESDIARFEIAVTTEAPRTARVVRGHLASRSVSLWQAQLFRFRQEDATSPEGLFSFRRAHRCGGAYLGDGFVLTAAHCIPREVGEIRVRLGSSDLRDGGTTFRIRSLVLHKLGNSREQRVDLALIQLDARPRNLEALGDDLEAIAIGVDRDPQFTALSRLTATGWGFVKERLPGETGWRAADGTRNTKANRLQQALLIPADETECTVREEFSAYQSADMLCLRGLMPDTDTCAGDSGGPVTSLGRDGRQLVGIISTGVGCAFQDVPAVYVNVAQHRDWIDRARKRMLTSLPGYYEMD